jgi:hypothetical protein
MILEHFSKEPIFQIRDRSQNETPSGVYKPIGLWVSVKGEDDWLAWCTGEDWGLEKMKYKYVVHLSSHAKLYTIQNSLELDLFHQNFFETYPGTSLEFVNWNRVASDYDGVIIAPYLWARRLNGRASNWYYGWDCASGCIWNARAISHLELIYPTPISPIMEFSA